MAMRMILDYPNGPVSLEGRWKDIRFKAWRGTRSKDISLTAQAARRLALALLLEAEKLEAKMVLGEGTTRKPAGSIDRAIDAVVRFHRADAKVRKRKDEREGRAFMRGYGKH